MADQGPASKKTRFRIDDKDGRSDEVLNTLDGIPVSFAGSVNNGNEEEINAERFEGSETDSNHIELMDSHHQEIEAKNASEQLCPLGLKLTATPSFRKLVEMTVSQERNRSQSNIVVDYEKNRAGSQDFPVLPSAAEKMSASSFNAKLLRIGTWERKPKYVGNLVAKCYFIKHKLAWEMLDRDELKSKMEIEWSDISAIRAIFGKNKADILEIELSQVPKFFREINPQPRKHTTWQPATDFTGGQASEYRRHYVEFHKGGFKKRYEKLLQCDKRLLELSNKPFPYQNSPYFNFNTAASQFPHMTTSIPSPPPRSPYFNFNTAASQFPHMMTSIPSPPPRSSYFDFNTAASQFPHMMTSIPSTPPRSPYFDFNTSASQFPHMMTSIPSPPPRSPYFDFNTAASQFPHMMTSIPSPPPLIYSQKGDDHLINDPFASVMKSMYKLPADDHMSKEPIPTISAGNTAATADDTISIEDFDIDTMEINPFWSQ